MRCAAIAPARRGLSAARHMAAAFGGNDARCAPYAAIGTPELARHVLAALKGRNACLMANRGVTVCAPGTDKALRPAVEPGTPARRARLRGTRRAGCPVA